MRLLYLYSNFNLGIWLFDPSVIYANREVATKHLSINKYEKDILFLFTNTYRLLDFL